MDTMGLDIFSAIPISLLLTVNNFRNYTAVPFILFENPHLDLSTTQASGYIGALVCVRWSIRMISCHWAGLYTTNVSLLCCFSTMFWFLSCARMQHIYWDYNFMTVMAIVNMCHIINVSTHWAQNKSIMFAQPPRFRHSVNNALFKSLK